jgi:hypothetical protein
MWDIKIILDEGRTDIGSVTATWTDGEEVFTFPLRHEVSDEGMVKFMQKAEAALLVHKGKASIEKSLSTKHTTTANRSKVG